MLSWKPQYPTLEPNITSIGKLVAKLWPIYVLKMAVGRHLGFYRTGNSAIRCADAENPWAKTNVHAVDRMHRLRDIHL